MLELWSEVALWRECLAVALGKPEPRAACECVLREWASAAGGSVDGRSIRLPDGLQRGLALSELRALGRDLGYQVHAENTVTVPSPVRQSRICERCLFFRCDPGAKRQHTCMRGSTCLEQRQSGDCGAAGLLWQPRRLAPAEAVAS